MADEAIIRRLRELVDEALTRAGQEPLDPSVGTDVFLPDMLDSIVLAGLISLIETEWNFEIDEESIDVDSFADLHSLAALVADNRSAGSNDG